MRLKIYKTDKKFLEKPCEKRNYIEGKLVAQQLRTAVLIKTISSQNPVGLASNQIGLTSRVFIAKVDKKWMTFINPIMEKHSEKTINFCEGCLSLNPKKTFMTKRYKWVQVSVDTGEGREHFKFEGFNSIIIQHELDHLDGKLCKEGGLNE